jgi:hypothetical protein
MGFHDREKVRRILRTLSSEPEGPEWFESVGHGGLDERDEDFKQLYARFRKMDANFLLFALPEVLSDLSSKVPSSWLRTSISAWLLVVTKYLNAEPGVLVALKCEVTLKLLYPPGKTVASGMAETRVGPPNAGGGGGANTVAKGSRPFQM